LPHVGIVESTEPEKASYPDTRATRSSRPTESTEPEKASYPDNLFRADVGVLESTEPEKASYPDDVHYLRKAVARVY